MEQQEFRHIITTIRPGLLSLCQRFFDKQHVACDAEDAVQETLLRLWQMCDRLESYQSPEALAVMIAKNVCIDMLRHSGLHPVPLGVHADAESSAQADQQTIANDVEQAVMKALSHLPATQRRMLLMRSEGMSMAEIAEACGATEASTKTMICSARKKMMEILKIRRSKK